MEVQGKKGNRKWMTNMTKISLLALLFPVSLVAQTSSSTSVPASLPLSQPSSAPLSQPVVAPSSEPSKPEIAPEILPFVPLVDASVDTSQTTLGGVIQYTLVIKHHKEVSVVVPDPLFFGREIRVRDIVPLKREESADEVTETRAYTLQVFGLEEVQIPAFTFDFRAPTGIAKVSSPSITITVPKTLPPEEDINDTFTPRDIEAAEAAWLTWLKTYGPYLFALLILSIVGYVLHKKRKKPIVAEVVTPKEDPTAAALRKLASLEAQRPHAKEFHLSLSETMRAYFEDALQIENAREATSAELLTKIQQLSEGKSRLIERKRLEQFLAENDMVKFAKYVPPLPDLLRSLEDVRSFVESTMFSAKKEE
jgi:hypothetical protein